MSQLLRFAIENRSINPFKKIINKFICERYTHYCNELQQAVQAFYEELLVSKHIGQVLKYLILDEGTHFVEKISLIDEGHGHASLSIAIDNEQIDEGRQTEYDPKPLSLVLAECKIFLTDEVYCSHLLKHRIHDFVHSLCNSLNKTHSLELNTFENGVFYFKATPYTGRGTISIVSRSDDAVIARDNENLQKLKELGYRAVLDDLYLTTWH
jgi:hypothetical protein